ncbi:hypothetical protein WA026_010191 [Henosepilachna vigintioctopunctata]|uniref:Uncharacterized protein n=1 Tax=Henosepilachna vigintioctopunctata TaxID=420089 RepID=A0AAW1UCE4_9CUCU
MEMNDESDQYGKRQTTIDINSDGKSLNIKKDLWTFDSLVKLQSDEGVPSPVLMKNSLNLFATATRSPVGIPDRLSCLPLSSLINVHVALDLLVELAIM